MEANNTPASSRQLWALFCATKIDHRNMGLTKEQAHERLSKLNEGREAKPKSNNKGLLAYMLDHVDQLKKALIDETKYGAIVMNDTNLLPDDGKRFIMLGGGCGFSWIRFDGRSKKGKAILEESGLIRKQVENAIVKSIDKKIIQYLNKCGNPIGALLLQNLQFNDEYNKVVMGYMRQVGVKNLWLDSRLD